MRRTRKVILVVLAGAIAALVVESISSYAIYRNFARTEKGYYPTGSATVALLKLFSYRFNGRIVHMSSDHGPVFYPDPTLGYAANPGRYVINEQIDGQKHRFQLTINDGGRRSTSYFPIHSPRHIFIDGDSAIFGWGLNDEDTVPWLLQTRIPQYEVVNWSMSGYSTVHELLQLEQAKPQMTPDDVVVLTYHPLAIELNVALASTFRDFPNGLESQLADPEFMARIDYPFGTIDGQGQFVIRRINLSCMRQIARGNCGRVTTDLSTAVQVTKRAFDEIINQHTGHLLVAIIGGFGSDPIIAYLRTKGVPIADLWPGASDPESRDVIFTDTHAGAFWSHFAFERLLSALQSNQFIQ